jgi:CRISPR/Cas system CMR subunit Cmr4 (Cas7 group RAMP superfamily)
VKPKVDRIHIEYDLKFATLFHCGTGIREVLIDRTVVRDSQGHLYVPGTTFKGVLRERCEQLARFYTSDEKAKQLIQSPHIAQAALQGLGNKRPTMVTRIFGSQNLPGKLFFDDARQIESDVQQYDGVEDNEQGKYNSLQVDVYTQVRLDRLTHTAVSGALYRSEFGINDIVFKGTIQGWLECIPINDRSNNVQRADDVPTYSLLLLLAGLNMIERLGGNKSTGKGQCECSIAGVSINGHDYQDAWKSWLEQIDALAVYYKSQEG